jgi:hypothetical protein
MIAEQIRRDIARPRRGRRALGGQPLSPAAAAFLYREKWGNNPPGWVVQAAMRELEGEDIRTDGFATALADEGLIRRLREAYSDGSGRYQFDANNHLVFLWIASAVVRGIDAAIREARRHGRGEAAYIDATAQHEALSDIDGPEDIVDALEHAQKDEDPASDVERWADGLDALGKCSMCGTALVDPDEFADAAMRHYRVRSGRKADRIRERLRDAVRDSGAEEASFGSSSLCSYCAHMMSKD